MSGFPLLSVYDIMYGTFLGRVRGGAIGALRRSTAGACMYELVEWVCAAFFGWLLVVTCLCACVAICTVLVQSMLAGVGRLAAAS